MHRRRIHHLVVVAGPSASGKATLIADILTNRLQELCTQLGISDPKEATLVKANSLGESAQGSVDTVIFHYDFFLFPKSGVAQRPTWGRSARTYERDENLDILKDSDEISFVTLWTAPDRLRRQVSQRHQLRLRRRLRRGELQPPDARTTMQRVMSAIRNHVPQSVKFWIRQMVGRDGPLRHQKRLETYGRPDEVLKMYRRWLRFTENQDFRVRNNLIVVYDQELTIYTREHWERSVTSHESFERIAPTSSEKKSPVESS